MFYDWAPYVPVAKRRENARREAAKYAKKGEPLSPVQVQGRAIAKTFWGNSWCQNLERYSDFANRLPRGRTYVRNGSVIDLKIAPGEVTALVSGSELYTVSVKVAAVPEKQWKALREDCAGGIDSLVELLQGRFAKGVMERICEPKKGLFPAPAELELECSCPDGAYMCKHLAAVLYGVGARLDSKPELLFHLRGADHAELVMAAGTGVGLGAAPKSAKVLESDGLADVFGIELADGTEKGPETQAKAAAKPRGAEKAKAAGAKQRKVPRRKKAKAAVARRTGAR